MAYLIVCRNNRFIRKSLNIICISCINTLFEGKFCRFKKIKIQGVFSVHELHCKRLIVAWFYNLLMIYWTKDLKPLAFTLQDITAKKYYICLNILDYNWWNNNISTSYSKFEELFRIQRFVRERRRYIIIRQ